MNQTWLRDSERAALLLSAIVDSSDDAIISKDLNGIITSWNNSAERVFGYSAEEAIGQPITMLIPPDRLEEEPKIIARIKAGERVDHIETVRLHKDGRRIDLSLTISPMRDAQGKIFGASKIARDVTGLRRADRAQKLLSAIVDSSDDAIISKDLNGIITSWNNSAERMFGYTAEEAIGRPITILIPTDRLEEEPKIIARIKCGERVDHVETVRQRKDGTTLDISLTISPIRDSTGKIVGASKIARDITQRKRADAEIRRANRDLEQFAFSASHDLQEPLRTIKIYSELLTLRYSEKFDGEALQFLGYLQNGATRMEALIRDLLAFTRISKLDVAPEETDANAVLSAALSALEEATAESGAQVTAAVLPRAHIRALHLQQVFQNLIGNAIKYRDPRRVPAVHVSGERQGACSLFSVSDNGIGIAPQYQESVFDLFKRLHTDAEYSGTGIGLAICQRIVEQYRGRIWLESEPGEGTTFKFTIPD